ncbi:MAG: GNAT family N-acetyltransferase [Bacteroidales bacterium]|nr:GNAT family N-acetyltransferase [Bacteroidales bacterium]
MKLNWEMYNSINNFEKSIWDSYMKVDNPFTGADFLQVVEAIHPNDEFYYIIGRNDDEQVVAIAFYYISSFDLLQNISQKILIKKLRQLFPSFMKLNLGMTATWETYGKHFWFNPLYLDYETFSAKFLHLIKNICKPHSIIVLRDYLDSLKHKQTASHLSINTKNGFVNTESLPVSKLTLNNNTTQDSYFYEIKKKHRVYMRKILAKRQQQNLKIEIIEDYIPLVGCLLYPLYQKVHANAKEYQTPLLPKSFFTHIKNTYNSNAKVLTIKDINSNIVAFVLMVQSANVLNPFLIGMDYSLREYNLWYHCTWECIMYAIKNNLSVIDLGATNYEMKQKIGAYKINNTISLRFKNNIMNMFFKKLLIIFAK